MSWLKSKSFLLGLLVFAAVAAFAVYSYVYKPHPEIENQKAVFVDTAESFQKAVADNQDEWINGIVELTGTVTSVDEKGLNLNASIYCQLKNPADIGKIKENSEVKIKGRFIGYDDLLEEVKLDQCLIQ